MPCPNPPWREDKVSRASQKPALSCYVASAMTTPQDPPKRRKQKARRAKQLSEWRAKNAEKPATEAKSKKS